MSAKRRADTIARFCVPVNDAAPAVGESMGMSSRLRPAGQSQFQKVEIGDNGSDASDFAPDHDDGSDYSATELESDEEPRAVQGKAKGKGKAIPKSSVLEALKELDGESNPRVMLISLKGAYFDQQRLRYLRRSRSRSFGPQSDRCKQCFPVNCSPFHLMYASLMYGSPAWTREFTRFGCFIADVLTDCRWWQEGIESQAIDRCNRIGMLVCTIRDMQSELISPLQVKQNPFACIS